MDINYEKILSEYGLLPLRSDRWQIFNLEHFANLEAADRALLSDLKARIRRNTGGVYVYRDITGVCIYVGKSQDLGRRFDTHFTRAHIPDYKGDRHGKHFKFWNSRPGRVEISWFEVSRESDRAIFEIMLTALLRPKFCEIPRTSRRVV